MTRNLVAILLLLASGAASADSWGPPTPFTATSGSGTYRLTVYPRQIDGPLAFFSDKVDGKEPAGQRADAQARSEATLEKLGSGSYGLVWRKPLANDVAPLSALVADDGRFVTFDNWHHAGIGQDAIVIYRADGTIVRELGVGDVIGGEAFEKLPRSVSSVWWGGEHRLSYDGAAIELQVVTSLGPNENPRFRTVRLDLSTGALLPGETAE